MTTSLQPIEEPVYHVAIVLPHSKQILAENDGLSLRLPKVTIQLWTRIAEQLTTKVKDQWHLHTVLVDLLVAADGLSGFAVLEVLSNDCPAYGRLQPCHIDRIYINSEHRTLLLEILDETDESRSEISRLGWISEAKAWLQANIRDRNLHFTNDIRQLNAGGGFALVRLGMSDGQAYWIKAAGAPNRHELSITEILFGFSPCSLPPLVAIHRNWNAWAMEEVGTALNNSIDVVTISLVAKNLARLQQQTIGHTQSILGSGCGNQQTEVLQDYLPTFINSVSTLFSNATPKGRSAILSRLENIVGRALSEIGELCIPDAINNNDMKLDNILFDGNRCVFTDWCHAYWGNPFITFQHLHTYLSRQLPNLAAPFRDTYFCAWSSFLTDVQIQRMRTLAPVVAPFAYICGRSSESLALRLEDPLYRKFCLRVVQRIAATNDLSGKRWE